jgi:hypothetical protein
MAEQSVNPKDILARGATLLENSRGTALKADLASATAKAESEKAQDALDKANANLHTPTPKSTS